MDDDNHHQHVNFHHSKLIFEDSSELVSESEEHLLVGEAVFVRSGSLLAGEATAAARLDLVLAGSHGHCIA